MQGWCGVCDAEYVNSRGSDVLVALHLRNAEVFNTNGNRLCFERLISGDCCFRMLAYTLVSAI